MRDFEKFKSFDEIMMKGNGVPDSIDLQKDNFVYVKRKVKNEITVFIPTTSESINYKWKDSLWIATREFEYETTFEKCIEKKYSTGDGLLLIVTKCSDPNKDTVYYCQVHSPNYVDFSHGIDTISYNYIWKKNDYFKNNSECLKRYFEDYILIYTVDRNAKVGILSNAYYKSGVINRNYEVDVEMLFKTYPNLWRINDF